MRSALTYPCEWENTAACDYCWAAHNDAVPYCTTDEYKMCKEMEKEQKQFTLCVDFDGVIHSYTSPWTTATDIPDAPVDEAFAWLEQMVGFYTIAIYSSRSKELGGIQAIIAWFLKYKLPALVLSKLKFPTEKPAAILYIDDRAWLYKGPGTMPTLEEIKKFRPWNR